MPKKPKRYRATRRSVDPADDPAMARPAPVSKATRDEYGGRLDEDAMLARYEASCDAAMSRGSGRSGPKVCRAHGGG